MSKPYGIIYRAINKINGKSYLGQTTISLERRMSQHKREASKRLETKDTQTPFYNAINKYGWDAFEWEILMECDCQNQVDEREKYYINHYKENGGVYNVKPGGNGTNHIKKNTRKHSPETIAKMTGQKRTPEQIQNIKDSCKNRKPISNETRVKMSESHKGKKLSNEHRQKLSISGKNRTLTPELKEKMAFGSRGKKRTDEHKKAISKAQKGKVVSVETREKMKGPRPKTQGISKSDEWKAKIKLTWTNERRAQHSKRNTGEGNPMYGKHFTHTQETKDKIGEASKQMWLDKKNKRIL